MEIVPPRPTPGSPEKRAVRSMFDRIAPRYDLLNRLLSAGTDRRWRRRAVDFLGLRPPARILDLCTGTADLLIEALGRDGGFHGVGVDLSGGMLRRGASKLHRAGLAARSCVSSADAERLPLASGRFDGAMIAFGIRNVREPEVALAEALRVLGPGGRLVVLEFSMPAGPLGIAYRLYFERVLPRIGGLVSGDRGAYSYLPASVARFPTAVGFARMLERAGFENVTSRSLTGGIARLYRGDKRR
jgi:demethylmenaquinone methyltransferase / 2-methoxy-6-polyprenyl-1,4-benzoquinol methylase